MPGSTSITQQQSNLPAAPGVNNFINSENGIQAQHIENLNVTGSVIIMPYGGNMPDITAYLNKNYPGLPQALPEQPVSHAEEWASLNRERYNLFLLENEKYEDCAFSIPRDYSLCRYMDREDIERFKLLSANSKNDIFNMPCIFAYRNSQFKFAEDNHHAILGRINDIYIQRENIKIRFTGFQNIPQQLINENLELFGLASASLRNELDEEHWSIKKIDLIEAVERLGIKVA